MRSVLLCIRFYLPVVLWSYGVLFSSALKGKDIHSKNYLNSTKIDTVCGVTEFPLMGTEPNAGQSGVWRIIQGTGNIPDSTLFNANVYSLSAGEQNILVWTLKVDATTFIYDTVKVYNGISPSQATVTYPSTKQHHICTNRDSLVAAVPGSGSGSWVYNAGFIADPKKNSVIISNLPLGKTNVTWKVSSKGCPDNMLPMEIYNDLPSKPFAGNDTSVCENTVQLKASRATFGKGKWSSPGILFDQDTSFSAKALGLKEGSNKLVWSLTNAACTLTDTVVVKNIAPTTARANNRQLSTCIDTIVLTAAPYTQGIGTWYTEAGSPALIIQEGLKARIKNLAEDSNYVYWKVENSFCNASKDSVLIINQQPSPAVILTQDDTLLCVKTVSLRAKMPVQGQGIWSSTTTPLNALVGELNITVPNLKQDTNVFVWTVSFAGCSPRSAKVHVINQIPDTVFAGADVEVCKDQASLRARKPLPGYAATWQLLNNQSLVIVQDFSNPNTVVSKLDKGNNFFIWKISKTGSSCPSGVAFAYDTVKIINLIPYPFTAGKDSSFYRISSATTQSQFLRSYSPLEIDQ
jgi:hypothetical protein